jgi:hypothetical protein
MGMIPTVKNTEVLEFSVQSGMCILCILLQATVWLQLADRGLFSPLKRDFYGAASSFVRQYGI